MSAPDLLLDAEGQTIKYVKPSLASARDGADEVALASPGYNCGRLLIVSNRLPITMSVAEGGASIRRSSGGLATGLSGPHERTGGLWIGWPGDSVSLDEAAVDLVDRELAKRRIVPVKLSARMARVFYNDVANGVLWPTFHDRLDSIPLETPAWDVYEEVNERFAETVAAAYQPGDLIWIHDYHLLRLPALLRKRLPNARIGFFLHIPFPHRGVYSALSYRVELLRGLLGADVIGFHTKEYADNFSASCRHLVPEARVSGASLRYEKRPVHVGVYPMGVDASNYAELAATPDVVQAASALRGGASRLLVGIDRLDYSKGIPRRLVAFELLLSRYPEWRGKVQLIQVAVPSREQVRAYRRFRRDLEERVGRINGAYATPTWSPVQYLNSSVSPETLSALYRAADVMLVTPVRDGMNLVAKEFVASRIDEDGVLLISEFAGAAAELADALVVNPYDTGAMADAMHQALTMRPSERRERMHRLREHVTTHDVHRWAAAFLTDLAAVSTG